MMTTRRQLLSFLPGLLLPKTLFALPNNDRKFIFVFCEGGWDPTVVFAPLFENANVDMENLSQPGESQGIRFVDNAQRPAVSQFFNAWGNRCLVVNGLDYETVAHDRGRRVMMTGASAGREDWGAMIASVSTQARTAPYLVVSGPTYATDLSPAVVRIGGRNQLRELLRFHDQNDLVVADRRAADLVDAYLSNRHAAGDVTSLDAALRFAGGMQRAQRQISQLVAQAGDLALFDPTSNSGSCDQTLDFELTLNALSTGLSRCVMISDMGFCQMGWDSHGFALEQSWHFQLLFRSLNLLMTGLSNRLDSTGAPLIDSTTVVVCSDFGRHPQLNELGGKHHWPVGSALLIGGVTGGRTVGGFGDRVLSKRVDLASGELSLSGVKLRPSNLGATLLALADVDPKEHMDADPILGVIS